MSLLGVDAGGPCEGAGPGHSIHCSCVAARSPNAMTDGDGNVFYPDNLEDARYFAQHYGAWPLHPAPFCEFLGGDL